MRKNLFIFVLVTVLLVSCTSLSNRDYLELVLDENPTTGYRWEFVTDDDVLDLVKDEFIPSRVKGLVGAGGQRFLKFEVLKQEDTSILLYYRRSWEDFPGAPDKVFFYNSKTNQLEQLI